MANNVIVTSVGSFPKQVSGVNTVREAITAAGFSMTGRIAQLNQEPCTFDDTVHDFDSIVVAENTKGGC